MRIEPADIPPPGWHWARVAFRGEVSPWIVVEVTERDGRRYVDQAGSDEGCAVAVWGPRLEPPGVTAKVSDAVDELRVLRARVVEIEGDLRVRDDQLDAARQRILAYDAHFSADTKPADVVRATPSPRAQCDPGAHIFMREAVEALREQRDAHGDKADPYDKLTIVARNLRDAFEWLWPLLWRDDPEFVPFDRRSRR